ncbi:MAG: alpha-galactosidase, partial [Candidatus Dormibacterales bacterium]
SGDGVGLSISLPQAGPGPASVLSAVAAFCRTAAGDLVESDRWQAADPGGARERRSLEGAGAVAGAGSYRTLLGPLNLTLRVRGRGGLMALRLEATSRRRADLMEIGLRFRPTIGGLPPDLVVHNGYQSWDPAGVSPGSGEAVESWWTCGLARSAGQGIALAAASARHFATRFEVGGATGGARLAHVPAPGIAGPAALWRAPKAGVVWRGEELVACAGADVRAALLAVASGGVAGDGGGRPAAPRGWLSWYQHGPWVAPGDVLRSAREISVGRFRGLGLGVVQVDDGWQESWGDWVPNVRFGAGLEALTGQIEREGLTPGVWVAPFLVGESSVLAAEAPDRWFLRSRPGGPRALDPRELPHRRFLVLDVRRPDVRAHIERTFSRLHGAGFRYFKIDFLYAGAYSGVPALRSALQAIRRAIGGSYLLACGAPLLPVADLVDGCRVAEDTATPVFDFESGRPRPAFVGDEIRSIARNLAWRSFLAPWFHLDADVALAGGDGTLEEARQLVTAVALSGGPFFAGDDLGALPRERRALLTGEAVAALAGGPPALPDWEPQPALRPPRVWRRPDGLVAVFNWEHDPARVEVSLSAAPPALSGGSVDPDGGRAREGARGAAHRVGALSVRELWTGQDLALSPAGEVSLRLPPRGVGLISPRAG